MIDLKTVQQIQQASIGERFHIIELLLQSLKHDMHTEMLSKQHPSKPFTIRQFSLGEEVQVNRDQLYAERSI